MSNEGIPTARRIMLVVERTSMDDRDQGDLTISLLTAVLLNTGINTGGHRPCPDTIVRGADQFT